MKTVFRLLLVCSWAVVLLMMTCTSNLEALLSDQTVSFTFRPHPSLADLWTFDLTSIHPQWLAVKFGHFLGFGVLDVLLWNLLRKQKPTLALSCLFALFTEIAQLYFNRDGRLYDVMIDTAGICLCHFTAQALLYIKAKSALGHADVFPDSRKAHANILT